MRGWREEEGPERRRLPAAEPGRRSIGFESTGRTMPFDVKKEAGERNVSIPKPVNEGYTVVLEDLSSLRGGLACYNE
jgi:hypothetical protein